jgi:hypothetical protein
VTQLDVNVPAHSGIAHAIFVRSSQVDASIRVTATQITGGSPVPGGYFTLVALNAAGTVTSLLQPEGVPPSLDITALEAYNGSLKSGSLKSGSLKSGSLKSGSLKSGSLKSGSLKSGSLKSGSLKSGSLKSTSIADLSTSSASTITTNGNEVDPSISSTCTATASPDDPITDAIYVLSNEGNTTATYTIRLVGVLPSGSCPVQLIVAQPGLSVTSQGCELVQQDDTIVVANITDLANLGDFAVSVPPNESLLVTIRGASIDIVENATENVAPQAAPPANSDGTQTTSTALFITTTSLPDGTFGASYPATTLQATGGTPPYTWSDLPVFTTLGQLGLTLDPGTGQITGTPNAAGNFTVKVQVCDSNLPQGTACDSTAPFDSRARKTLNLFVQKADQTITVTTPAPAIAAYNTNIPVAATASSGLPVDITTTGVCSVSSGGSGTATILITSGAGICTVHYNRAGDSNYFPAPEVTSNTAAVKADQTITVTTPAPASAIYNTSFPVAATSDSGLAVAISVSGVCSGSGSGSATVLMTSGTGTCTVHYNQAGDGSNYNAAPEVTSDTAAVKADQTITVTTPAPASAIYNTSFSVAATSDSGLAVAISVSGVCSGSGSGSATVLMTSGTGTCTVHFNQAGNANYNPAPEVASDTTAVKANQTIAVTTPAPASAVYSTSFPVAGAASSGLPVAITITGVCSGSGSGSATITMTSGTGTCTVHYNQAGNANYNPAPEVTSNTAAVKANSTTTITSDAPDPSILGQSVPVSFTVTLNPPGSGTFTGSVTISAGNGTSCTVGVSAGSCTLTFTTVGTKTLTATYSGDNNFNGSSATNPHLVIYNFNGFLSPLSTAAGTFSNPTMVPGTTNRGSVVPLKWLLTDFSGNLISDLSSLTLLQAIPNSACAGPPSGAPVVLYAPTSGAAGGSTFRYSSQFIFNWDTSTTINSAAGCFTVVVQLNDGSALKAMTIKFQ